MQIVMMTDQHVRANNGLTMRTWILQLPKQGLTTTTVIASICNALRHQNSQKIAIQTVLQLIF